MNQIITALTRASLTDQTAKTRLNQIFDSLLAEDRRADYDRLQDLYWQTLDEARTELAQGKPDLQQPQLPCRRTRKAKKGRGKTAKERGAYNRKSVNYAEKVLYNEN